MFLRMRKKNIKIKIKQTQYNSAVYTAQLVDLSYNNILGKRISLTISQSPKALKSAVIVDCLQLQVRHGHNVTGCEFKKKKKKKIVTWPRSNAQVGGRVPPLNNNKNKI